MINDQPQTRPDQTKAITDVNIGNYLGTFFYGIVITVLFSVLLLSLLAADGM